MIFSSLYQWYNGPEKRWRDVGRNNSIFYTVGLIVLGVGLLFVPIPGLAQGTGFALIASVTSGAATGLASAGASIALGLVSGAALDAIRLVDTQILGRLFLNEQQSAGRRVGSIGFFVGYAIDRLSKVPGFGSFTSKFGLESVNLQYDASKKQAKSSLASPEKTDAHIATVMTPSTLDRKQGSVTQKLPLKKAVRQPELVATTHVSAKTSEVGLDIEVPKKNTEQELAGRQLSSTHEGDNSNDGATQTRARVLGPFGIFHQPLTQNEQEPLNPLPAKAPSLYNPVAKLLRIRDLPQVKNQLESLDEQVKQVDPKGEFDSTYWQVRENIFKQYHIAMDDPEKSDPLKNNADLSQLKRDILSLEAQVESYKAKNAPKFNK